MSIPSSFSTAGRNLSRRPARTALLALLIASVAGMQISAALLDRASKAGLELGLERLGADLVVVPKGFEESMYEALMRGKAGLFYMNTSVEEKIASLDFVERTAPQIYVQSLSGASCCSLASIFLIGFDPKQDFTIRPWLGDSKLGRLKEKEILVGASIDVVPGDELKFFGQTFRVAGVLDVSGTGLDASIYIPLPSVYLMAAESSKKAEKTLSISENEISAVLVRLAEKDRAGIHLLKAASRMEQEIPEIGVILPDEMLAKTERSLQGTLRTLHSATYATWPLAAVFLGMVFMFTTNERRREIGLLLALGATRRMIFQSIVQEALMITALGTTLGMFGGVAIVLGFSRVIVARIGIPFYWPSAYWLVSILLATLGVALITGALAALYPALKISREEPRRVLFEDPW